MPEPIEPVARLGGAGGAPADSSGDSPLVLIPVTAEDVTRQKRRRVLTWLIVMLVILGIGGWIYKVKTDPVRAQESFDGAQRLFASARYRETIVACDRAIALKPDFADAFMLRGKARVADYTPERGIPDFTKAIELRPGDPQAPIERAHAYIEQKNYTAAISDASAAIALDPKLGRAYNLRGTALRALGETQQAIEAFSRAVGLEPNADNFYQRGATYQILGDHQSAILDFTQAIGINPDTPEAYFARAESERAVGDMEQAQKDHDYGRYLDGR
ncbi:MAG TPA: tetratricopeptide repeat protein [Bryobacteraceae bacterium]